MNILVTMPSGVIQNTFIPVEAIERLESMGNVFWNMSDKQFSTDELREKIIDMDVCISGWGCRQFDKSVLEGAERLKLIAHTGGTVAAIVSDYAYEKGIKVISGNWIFAESVAEGVIAYILGSLREIPFYSNEMQAGRWRVEGCSYNEGLLEQTVGLVGFGAVARFLVKMLAPFRVKIKVFDPYITDDICIKYGVERATLKTIFSTSKIISIHAPKTPDTYHMIGRDLLQMIADGALIVNTARGSIIDENALAEELEEKRFKAVLDVFEVEPLPADSKLRGLPNVILIPHMAGPTTDRRKSVTLALIEDIQNFFNGRQLKYEIGKDYAMAMTR